MPSKRSRRSFCALVGGIGTASAIGGAGTYAFYTDDETASGTIQAASQFPIRINCGGPEYTANDGTVFSADQYNSGGSTYDTADSIANTSDDTLYQTERWGNGFGYDIPVANGTYDVRIHLAEIYFGPTGDGGGGVGDRIFDLDVEGTLLLDDYDLYADVGHDTAVVHVAQGVSVTDGTLNITGTASQNNAKISAIEVVPSSGSPPPQPSYQQVDTTGSGASIDVANLIIDAAGTDVWTNNDEYGAIYENDVSGDFTATVTVDSQENVHPWSKAGIMVANDITDGGGSAGDLYTLVTPERGFAVQWDSDGDGFTDSSTEDGSSVYPSQLRVEKTGTTFTGSYSTDGGSTWTVVDTVTIPEANATQDVGLAVTSHDASQASEVDFSNFQIT